MTFGFLTGGFVLSSSRLGRRVRVKAASRTARWERALSTIIQIASGTPLLVVLYGIKLAIHVFGAVTAYLAQKAFAESSL